MKYKVGDTVYVSDSMQTNYSYLVEAEMGKEFDENFQPFYSPETMLEMGVFEGKYCNCLLYTSPSPRDVEESRMPSSA